MAVTNPASETVARLALLVLHEMVRPFSVVPAASFTVAVSVIVCPWLIVCADGVMVTLPAAVRTVTETGIVPAKTIVVPGKLVNVVVK